MFTDFGKDFRERFQIIKRLGRGAFGIVYEARQLSLDRHVAIKYQLERKNHKKEMEERFIREAKILKDINHERIVRLYDVGFDGDVPYIVEEFLDGCPLDEILDDNGKLPLPQALLYAEQVAEGLAAAHDANIFHRDIKPANIFIVKGKGAKILDFGLGKREGVDKTLTKTGQIVGTPAYAAPEQLHGFRPTASMDIYALGTMIWVFLAGEPPFTSRRPNDLLRKMSESPPSIKTIVPGLDDDLAQFVDAMVAHAPADRPKDMHQIGKVIHALRTGKNLPKFWTKWLAERQKANDPQKAVAIDSKPTAAVEPTAPTKELKRPRKKKESKSQISAIVEQKRLFFGSALLLSVLVFALFYGRIFSGSPNSLGNGPKSKTYVVQPKLVVKLLKTQPTSALLSIETTVATTTRIEIKDKKSGDKVKEFVLPGRGKKWKTTLDTLRENNPYRVRISSITSHGPLRKDLSLKTKKVELYPLVKRHVVMKQKAGTLELTSYFGKTIRRCPSSRELWQGHLVYALQTYGMFTVDLAQKKIIKENRELKDLRTLRIYEDYIYTLSDDLKMCRWRAKDFALKWTQKLPAEPMYGMYVNGGRIFVWIVGQGMRVYSCANGKLLWQYDYVETNLRRISWRLTTDGIIWVNSAPDEIMALHTVTGKAIDGLKFTPGSDIPDGPVKVGSKYFVPTFDGRVVGGEKGSLSSFDLDVLEKNEGPVDHLESDGRYLYCQMRRPTTIFAVDVEKKKVLWRFPLKKRIDARMILHAGRLYFCDAQKARVLHCLNPRTGELLWSRSTDLKASFGIVPVPGGILYCSGIFLELMMARDH